MESVDTIVTVDLGMRKSAIAVIQRSKRIQVASIYAYSYVDPSIFLNISERVLKNTHFDSLVVEVPRKLQGKEHISKEDFFKINSLTENFLDNTENIIKDKPFNIYTSYATNKFGYSSLKGNLDPIGWRQRLTGLARPNEKDIFYQLQALEDNKEIKFSDEALDVIYRNQTRRIFYDIIDAVGLGVTFCKYPDVFEEYNKEQSNKQQKNLKKLFGKNISEATVKEINKELYKVFIGN